MRSMTCVWSAVLSLALASCCPCQTRAASSLSAATTAPASMPSVATTTPVSPDDDHSSLCQAVIDLPELQPYFHPDAPGRGPLLIVRTGQRCDDLPLHALGQAVVFRSAEELDKGAAALELTRVDLEGDEARVKLRYSIEGVSGVVDLRRVEGRWSVVKREIAEH